MKNTSLLRYGHYCTDGSGRDTYIAVNHGGSMSEYTTPGVCKFGAIPTFGKLQDGMRQRNGYSPAKTNSYNTNGTGRDSYISVTSGGNHFDHPKVHWSTQYVNSLRDSSQQGQPSMQEISKHRNRNSLYGPDHFIDGQIRTISPQQRALNYKIMQK